MVKATAPLNLVNTTTSGKLFTWAMPKGATPENKSPLSVLKTNQIARVFLIAPEEDWYQESGQDQFTLKELYESEGIKVTYLPIKNGQTCKVEEMVALTGEMEESLKAGENIVLHCRQGMGRTALVVACLASTLLSISDYEAKQFAYQNIPGASLTTKQLKFITEFHDQIRPNSEAVALRGQSRAIRVMIATLSEAMKSQNHFPQANLTMYIDPVTGDIYFTPPKDVETVQGSLFFNVETGEIKVTLPPLQNFSFYLFSRFHSMLETALEEEHLSFESVLKGMRRARNDYLFSHVLVRFYRRFGTKNNNLNIISSKGFEEPIDAHPIFIGNRQYIACSAPKKDSKHGNNAENFWAMAFQHRASTIFKLTNTMLPEKPGDTNRVYTPPFDCDLQFGPYRVTNIEEVQLHPDIVVRTLFVEKDNEGRCIRQIDFTGWVDQSVPNEETLKIAIDYLNQMHAQDDPLSSTIVHCSAGIGRTGTLLSILDTGRTVDDSILRLREHRPASVETIQQYEFISRMRLYLSHAN